MIKVNDEIVLREIQEEDAETIFKTIDSQREYLGEWLPFVELTQEKEDTLRFIQAMLKRPEDEREFVFTIRYQGDFAGLIGFRDTDRLNRKTEIGYWLSFDYQKKGIVIQSVSKLMEFAFDELEMNRVQVKCAVQNIRSKRIPEKLGFVHEGTERAGELFPGGKFVDLDIYSKLKMDF